MTPPAAATYQALESDSAKRVLLVCPACLHMLQTHPLSVGKTGHCVHCRHPLRAESDGMGGVRAVSLPAIGPGMPDPPDGARNLRALPHAEAPASLHAKPLPTIHPTFASSATIPPRWGFPAREPEEEQPLDFVPPGFAEALFGEGNVSVQRVGLRATSDQPRSLASRPDDNPRDILSASPVKPSRVTFSWTKPPSARSKLGKYLKILGALLAITCLVYATYRFCPTPPWEEWQGSARALMQSSLGAGSDLSGQNTEAARR
jgi:hypothetical protein